MVFVIVIVNVNVKLSSALPEVFLSLLALDEVVVSLASLSILSLAGLSLLDAFLQTIGRTADGNVGCACLAAVSDGIAILTNQSVDVSHLQVSLTSQVGIIVDSLLSVGQGTGVLL